MPLFSANIWKNKNEKDESMLYFKKKQQELDFFLQIKVLHSRLHYTL